MKKAENSPEKESGGSSGKVHVDQGVSKKGGPKRSQSKSFKKGREEKSRRKKEGGSRKSKK